MALIDFDTKLLVVNQITLNYPELSEAMYTGFIDVQNDAAHSASTTE